jgi:hypothetical protein
MNNTAAPLIPFLHGVAGEPESAYWVYASVNVVFGLVFAFLLTRGLQGKQDESLAI